MNCFMLPRSANRSVYIMLCCVVSFVFIQDYLCSSPPEVTNKSSELRTDFFSIKEFQSRFRISDENLKGLFVPGGPAIFSKPTPNFAYCMRSGCLCELERFKSNVTILIQPDPNVTEFEFVNVNQWSTNIADLKKVLGFLSGDFAKIARDKGKFNTLIVKLNAYNVEEWEASGYGDDDSSKR